MPTSIRSEATRSVVVVNGVDRLAINEDGSMELLTPAANPTGNDVPTVGQLGFGKMYKSPEQPFTAGSQVLLNHGLGAAPSLVNVLLVCKTAEFGFSVGDEVDVMGAVYSASAVNGGVSVRRSPTHVAVSVGSAGIVVVRPDTFLGATVTPAKWRLVVRAWA